MPVLPNYDPGLPTKKEDVTDAMRRFADKVDGLNPQTKLLPPNLIDEIRKAAEVERKTVNEKIARVDKAIEAVQKTIDSERAERKKKFAKVNGAQYSTEETARISLSFRIKSNYKTDLQKAKTQLQTQLGNIRKVERACNQGVRSAILQVMETWEKPPIAIMGSVGPEERPDGDKIKNMER